MLRRILLAGVAALCVSKSPAMADAARDFARIATGHWSSIDQADSEEYSWVDSRTWQVMADREDGVWLYQQNAIVGANRQDVPENGVMPAPYFQVVIQFRDMGDGLVHTTTYRLTDRAGPLAFSRGELSAFSPDWIGEASCMGTMKRIAEDYWMGGADCPNSFRGGVRVDSKSIRTRDSYVNWDRGFDVEGKHVWGPASGGYIFKRVKE